MKRTEKDNQPNPRKTKEIIGFNTETLPAERPVLTEAWPEDERSVTHSRGMAGTKDTTNLSKFF